VRLVLLHPAGFVDLREKIQKFVRKRFSNHVVEQTAKLSANRSLPGSDGAELFAWTLSPVGHGVALLLFQFLRRLIGVEEQRLAINLCISHLSQLGNEIDDLVLEDRSANFGDRLRV
jgi:hypothetical protein